MLTVSSLKSHMDTKAQRQEISVKALYKRLQNPRVDDITMEQFQNLTVVPEGTPEEDARQIRRRGRDEQGRRKAAAGGYMLGAYQNDSRKAPVVVEYRTALAIDCDDLPEQGRRDNIRKDITTRLDRLGCSYIIHETRKSTIKRPRYRIIIPLERPCSPDMYKALVRVVGGLILKPEWVDPSCDQAERMMYWPTISKGQGYHYDGDILAERPLLDGEQLLDDYIDGDWHDQSTWPELGSDAVATAAGCAGVTRAPGRHAKAGETQADPCLKSGYIGAFCRLYPISKAIEAFLSGGPASDTYKALTSKDRYPLAYEPAEHGRYSYCGPDTTTTGGAVLYDDDRFLYSNHSTDPYHYQLLNSWDLVRLHLFGYMDIGDDRPEPKEAYSATAMKRFVKSIDGIAVERAAGDFAMEEPEPGAVLEAALDAWCTDDGAPPDEAAPDVEAPPDAGGRPDWIDHMYSLLEWTKGDEAHGIEPKIRSTRDNYITILEYDQNLSGKIRRNQYACRDEVRGRLPRISRREGDEKKHVVTFEPPRESPMFVDADEAVIRHYFEQRYRLESKPKLDDALAIVAQRNAFHPVRSYFDSLPEWDGVERAETLLHDYLGAEDTPVVREVTLKHLLAAVTRIYHPGTKYDVMVVLYGRQGLGKSTLIQKLAGSDWFCDSIGDLGKTDSVLTMQGHIFVEFGELDALRKSEVTQIKSFVSRQDDEFRVPYGHRPESHPRQCVFWGTTNQPSYLRDLTGNRRFACIDCAADPEAETLMNVFTDLDRDRDQIWAEVVEIYRQDEARYWKGDGLKYTEATARSLGAMAEEHRDADPREAAILDYCLKEIPDDWPKWSESDRQRYYAGENHLSFRAEPVVAVRRKYVCVLGVWIEALGGRRDKIPAADKALIQGVLNRAPWLEPVQYRDRIYGKVRGWKIVGAPEPELIEEDDASPDELPF